MARIEAGDRFVEEQHAVFAGRLGGQQLHDDARELHALLLAARQRRIPPAGEFGGIGQRECLLDQRLQSGRRQFGNG